MSTTSALPASSAPVATPVLRPAAAKTQKSGQAAPSVSSAAQTPAASQQASQVAAVTAAAAALKEATETSAQTAKEAAGGDRQAQKLLAKQATEKAERTGESTQTVGGKIDVKA